GVLDLSDLLPLQLHRARHSARRTCPALGGAPAGDGLGGPRAPADPRAGGSAPLGPTRPGRVRLAVRRRPGAGDGGPRERRAADRAGRPAAGPVTEPRWPATPREGAGRAG